MGILNRKQTTYVSSNQENRTRLNNWPVNRRIQHSTTRQSLNKFNKPFKRSHWFKPQRTSSQPRTETNRTFTKPISYLNLSNRIFKEYTLRCSRTFIAETMKHTIGRKKIHTFYERKKR